MAGNEHPFVDNGEGFPTLESARAALQGFDLGLLADVEVSHQGHKGPVDEMITGCKIEHLVTNWPAGFIGMVIGLATESAQG